jgi:preprotein translocase subunit SecD
MLYFQTWKLVLILGVCLLGVIFALPNAFAPETLAHWPSYIPKKQVSLGLDLRGGSHLLLEVDMAAVETERLAGVVDELRTQFTAAKVGYTDLRADSNRVIFTVRDLDRIKDARDIVTKIDPDLDVQIATNGAASLTSNEIALVKRRSDVIDRSLAIVRRRIDELGTKEPTVQREGDDRILVQVPGLDDPERLKKILGETAKMTFQLVDVNASPEDARNGKLPPGDVLLPSVTTSNGQPTQFYVVRRRVMVSGETLTDAQPTFGQNNDPVVSFTFDSTGARRFGDATRDNVKKPFAIVLDNKVISAPVIQEPILGGRGQISGNFTTQTAFDLALLLRAGALPARLTVIEERTVGPDLGADSIHAGALASIVGVALVIAFMIVFYGLFGIFADVALFFNLCIMLGSLSLLGATLTLPGIAGIALTMGMAVDANVLIYERIREEVRGGRSLISSLQAGFERAFGTILDSHVTTLVAGALMFWLGSGPVKGFAVTLSLGVLTSLFSAILVTRLQIVTWLRQTKPKIIPI